MASVRVNTDVSGNLSRVRAAIADAREKWSGIGVKANSWFGGVDPDQILGSLNVLENGAYGKPGTYAVWRTQGEALLQDPAPTQATLDKWNDLGRIMLSEAESAGVSAADSNLTRVIADTVTATVVEVRDDVAGALTFWGSYGKSIILAGVVLALALVVWRNWGLLSRLFARGA